MHAIILAAGMGSRFQPEPLPYPKSLLQFGAKSLLARSIENLAWAGCDAVTVVAGYRAELIEHEVERLKPVLPGLEIGVRYNPNYKGGSAGSVVCAADVLESRVTLMLDADILYDRRILLRIVQAADENVILVEQKESSSQVEYWLVAQDSRIIQIHKGTQKPAGTIGIYWGVHKFSATLGKQFVALARSMFQENSGTEYWYVLPLLFQKLVIGYADTAGMIYCEMDTRQEVEWARTHLYPQFVALGQA